ncbi:MAG: phosphoribosyltransferase [Sphingobium sp.]|uniref:phosphoribosyltransferase n=1 Tax=Sphingobium sp. TaxID=1912891 RepID=UPI000DB75F1C|nr:phosphoribosyltransferase domain-containing protein [Sphingobium sp.]PZU09428.1 MAG: phosphoribosyltransferase [Sphingobium sp.]
MTHAAQPDLFSISHDAFLADVTALSAVLAADSWRPDYLIGIGRGGLVPAVYVSHRLNLPMLSVDHSSKVPGFADELLGKVAAKSAAGAKLLIMDDINDSGGTIAHVRRLLGDHGYDARNLRFAVLLNNIRSRASVDYWAQTIDRDSDKRWFVFPWEAGAAKENIVAEAASVPERLR